MKKITVLFLAIIMVIVFCACDSEEVKKAKEAYEKEDYAKAVELLSKEKDLSDEAKDILVISEANVLYKDKKYLDAVKKLSSSEEGTKAEQFEDMFKAALDDAINNHSASTVVELLKIDDSKTDAVYKAVTKACKDKDYNGFLVLDGLVKKLDDGDLKTKLSDFDKEYKILRAEAFMIGTWERQDGANKVLPCVKVTSYNDNLVGRLIRVGDDQKDRHFHKDDIYWKDFEFESGKKFIYFNLTKYSDGTPAGRISSGKINYRKGVVEVNVTGSSNPFNTWKRLNK